MDKCERWQKKPFAAAGKRGMKGQEQRGGRKVRPWPFFLSALKKAPERTGGWRDGDENIIFPLRGAAAVEANRPPGNRAAKLRSRCCSPSAAAERSNAAGGGDRGGRRGQSPQPHVSGQERQGPVRQPRSKCSKIPRCGDEV